jgi:PadR family transcriptional regulator PadR
MLEVCVLASLSREDSYGYKIIKDVGVCIEISESTLYPILKRLESGGMLEVYSVEHSGRLRKYYRLLGPGRVRIEEFLREWGDVTRVYNFINNGGM